MPRAGWRGGRPASDEEARQRIIGAAMRCIDRYGPTKTGLSDVAAELGVTRQTVYRHFAGTEELLHAVGQAAVDTYLDRLAVDVAGITDPAEAMVEAIAHTVERLPNEPYLGILLATGRSEAFLHSVTSPIAIQFGRQMLDRMDVDWARHGFDDEELDGLVEFTLRILQSLVLDPATPTRTSARLRAFLRRWVAPSIAYRPVPARP